MQAQAPTFAVDIQPLFRERDRRAMTFLFDLWDYEAVKTNADAILAVTAGGDMPCDEAWPVERSRPAPALDRGRLSAIGPAGPEGHRRRPPLDCRRVSEGQSFHGSARTGGPNERRVSALVVVLLIAGVAVAIAKPWGSPDQPAPPSQPPLAVASPAASIPTPAPEMPSPAPSPSIAPLPVAFTTPPSSASATWTGLNWRRLAPGDPLNLVTSVLRWRRGLVAVGWVAGTPSTPVWTSMDGSHWEPLPFNSATTFWPGLAVLRLADLPTGLVALTESLPYCGGACSLDYVLPVVSWTSADGRRWTPHLLLPVAWLANPRGVAPLFADGPAGLVVATSGPSAHLVSSTDGSHWQSLPTSTLPARFWLNDLRGTTTGYVAVGRWTATANRPQAASLWSADGRHWSRVPTLMPTLSAKGSELGSVVAALVIGRHGMIAVGRRVTSPGAALWWWSTDGRRWQPLPTFVPLGPTTCTGEGCGRLPNGALVGDGNRMLAVRGGPDAHAWTSTDGRIWRPLRLTGDIPSERATQATLLPGGVLISDGTATWFGQAEGP